MIEWKNFFKPEDLSPWLMHDESAHQLELKLIVDSANTRLWAVIQCLEKVYGNTNHLEYHGEPCVWSNRQHNDDSHCARIINIEKIQRGVS